MTSSTTPLVGSTTTSGAPGARHRRRRRRCGRGRNRSEPVPPVRDCADQRAGTPDATASVAASRAKPNVARPERCPHRRRSGQEAAQEARAAVDRSWTVHGRVGDLVRQVAASGCSAANAVRCRSISRSRRWRDRNRSSSAPFRRFYPAAQRLQGGVVSGLDGADRDAQPIGDLGQRQTPPSSEERRPCEAPVLRQDSARPMASRASAARNGSPLSRSTSSTSRVRAAAPLAEPRATDVDEDLAEPGVELGPVRAGWPSRARLEPRPPERRPGLRPRRPADSRPDDMRSTARLREPRRKRCRMPGLEPAWSGGAPWSRRRPGWLP